MNLTTNGTTYRVDRDEDLIPLLLAKTPAQVQQILKTLPIVHPVDPMWKDWLAGLALAVLLGFLFYTL